MTLVLAGSSSSDMIEGRQRPIQKPLFLDFADVSNEDLVASLQDLLENDPVRLAILHSRQQKILSTTKASDGNIQTKASWDEHEASCCHSPS